ncbi:hypothetical protein BKA67DRAFT_531269 [Truncatella angustata]|uniref:Uncharacterized protein n=1 Tax=Truncatella angustata TaxID=152316 RepID=A0A9P9A462_9PEZI|nr:uncharacterized protein BKA67DRAFT_531269 [Truncatella angustata]KAH6661202.1 hypothetical protein BKA67DRAFT_531269 [Truncatella angustata]
MADNNFTLVDHEKTDNALISSVCANSRTADDLQELWEGAWALWMFSTGCDRSYRPESSEALERITEGMDPDVSSTKHPREGNSSSEELEHSPKRQRTESLTRKISKLAITAQGALSPVDAESPKSKRKPLPTLPEETRKKRSKPRLKPRAITPDSGASGSGHATPKTPSKPQPQSAARSLTVDSSFESGPKVSGSGLRPVPASPSLATAQTSATVRVSQPEPADEQLPILRGGPSPSGKVWQRTTAQERSPNTAIKWKSLAVTALLRVIHASSGLTVQIKVSGQEGATHTQESRIVASTQGEKQADREDEKTDEALLLADSHLYLVT